MLSLDTVDRPSVLRGVATIAELPDRAIEQVHSIEGVDHEHLLEWEGPVRGGFAQAYVLANPAQTVTAHVTDVALFALRGCARAIDRAPQGREVDRKSTRLNSSHWE